MISTPLFKYLTTQSNPDFTGDIKWNFEKFLINEKGELVHRYRSAVKAAGSGNYEKLTNFNYIVKGST